MTEKGKLEILEARFKKTKPAILAKARDRKSKPISKRELIEIWRVIKMTPLIRDRKYDEVDLAAKRHPSQADLLEIAMMAEGIDGVTVDWEDVNL